MKKHEKNLQKFIVPTFTLSVLAIIVSCVTTLAVIDTRSQFNIYSKDAVNNHFKDWYGMVRITFCYDNNIHPCDDDALTAWNTAHPDDKFSITMPALD